MYAVFVDIEYITSGVLQLKSFEHCTTCRFDKTLNVWYSYAEHTCFEGTSTVRRSSANRAETGDFFHLDLAKKRACDHMTK